MGSLDFFRTTVGAGAVGFAQRALDESLHYARQRHAFGKPIAEFQAIQTKLAAMATELAAARLLVYRAALTRDSGRKPRVTLESAQAKLFATEAAQRIIDQAVQVHGGYGVMKGYEVERLYREIRALRIYEGTSEIQHLVIASQLLRESVLEKGPASCPTHAAADLYDELRARQSPLGGLVRSGVPGDSQRHGQPRAPPAAIPVLRGEGARRAPRRRRRKRVHRLHPRLRVAAPRPRPPGRRRGDSALRRRRHQLRHATPARIGTGAPARGHDSVRRKGDLL